MNFLFTPIHWTLRMQVRVGLCVLIATAALGTAELIARQNAPPGAVDPGRQALPGAKAPAAIGLGQARLEAMTWALGLGGLCALIGWWGVGRLITPGDAPSDTPPRQQRTPFPQGVRPRRRTDVTRVPMASLIQHGNAGSSDDSLPLPAEHPHVDPLTGLWNKLYLAELVQQERVEAAEFCLLRINLDGFSGINERCGQEAGDQVLMQTARRLRHLARSEDFVFRHGSDEFLMLLPCPQGEGMALAKSIAARVLTDVQRPMTYRTLSNLRVGCSIGSAVWNSGGTSFDDTLQHALEALQGARLGGRGHFRHYAAIPSKPAATAPETTAD